MKKIIVPVDFSEYSERALKVASDIARTQNAELIVVHMMGLSDAVLTKDNSTDLEGMFFIKLAKKRFEEFLDKDYLEDVTVNSIVKNHTVFSELDLVAKEHNADLIVMGSHGSSGLSEMFVGSNTEKVVRTAETPVLVIKDTSNFNVQKAVFASDFKEESVPAFIKVISLFETLNIKTELVYINLPGEGYLSTKEIEQRIVDFIIHLKDINLKPEDITIYADYTVEKGIFNYTKRVKADIISIPTHGRRGLAHLFSGSIGEDVVNHSRLPVLSVKI